MTPKQLVILMERNRLERVHFEHILAYNTCASINYSQFAPEQGVPLTDFMPSYKDKGKAKRTRTGIDHLTDEQLQEMSDFNVRKAELALKLAEQVGR